MIHSHKILIMSEHCKTHLKELRKQLTVQNIDVGMSLNATLASPKSQTLSLQFAFANIFFGLRSR